MSAPPRLDTAVSSRDQMILAAAERLFSEWSFDGVGIDQIAAEAGIVGSGVYKYFDGKQDILATLLNQAADTALQHVPDPTGAPAEDLNAAVHASGRYPRFVVNCQMGRCGKDAW